MEQQPIQVTTKNPKKVEAGKKLAEYNRKKREELKKAKLEESESKTINSNNCYYGAGIITAVVSLGIISYYYAYKSNNNNTISNNIISNSNNISNSSNNIPAEKPVVSSKFEME